MTIVLLLGLNTESRSSRNINSTLLLFTLLLLLLLLNCSRSHDSLELFAGFVAFEACLNFGGCALGFVFGQLIMPDRVNLIPVN